MNKKASTGLKRDVIDKFYTKKCVVDTCVDSIESIISKHDTIIEPSAGDGAFIDRLKKLCDTCIFLDIEPHSQEIKKCDFLEQNFSHRENQKIHVIGNPPFGRQSSTAIKFIRKACEFADTIAFILPKSFKKDSMKRHFYAHFHLAHEFDLPSNSFLVNGEDEYDVPCVFQVWIKDVNKTREEPVKLEPEGYEFVKKSENPDVSIRRVGVYAGKIDTNIEDKSEQSHYFIKFLEPFSILSQVEFDNAENTVGPKSISKQDVIRALNRRMLE